MAPHVVGGVSLSHGAHLVRARVRVRVRVRGGGGMAPHVGGGMAWAV